MKMPLLLAFLLVAAASLAQNSKWLKDENNILTVTITDQATKPQLAELQKQLWDSYQIKFECPEMVFRKQEKKLKSLSIRVEMPTGEVGTVGTSFVKPGQVVGFHFDRNNDAYDVFGVWTR